MLQKSGFIGLCKNIYILLSRVLWINISWLPVPYSVHPRRGEPVIDRLQIMMSSPAITCFFLYKLVVI
jgi:hypothetical protein